MSGSSVSLPIDLDASAAGEPQRGGVLAVGSRVGPALQKALLVFLHGRMPPARLWIASHMTLQYLQIIGNGDVFVDRRQAPASLSFIYSGAAGTGQTTSDVLAHWTKVWLKEQLPALTRDVLAPAGLHPKGPPTEHGQVSLFVPCGEYAYGNLYRWQGDDEMQFAIDSEQVLDEMFPEEREGEFSRHPYIQGLYERALEETGGTRCLCQICAPTFDPARMLEGLEPPELG